MRRVQQGQGMTEYIVVVAAIMAALILTPAPGYGEDGPSVMEVLASTLKKNYEGYSFGISNAHYYEPKGVPPPPVSAARKSEAPIVPLPAALDTAPAAPPPVAAAVASPAPSSEKKLLISEEEARALFEKKSVSGPALNNNAAEGVIVVFPDNGNPGTSRRVEAFLLNGNLFVSDNGISLGRFDSVDGKSGFLRQANGQRVAIQLERVASTK